MKIRNAPTQRKRIFLCLVLTMLCAGLSAQDPNNWCATIPIPSSWRDCNAHLLPKYTPICPGSHCDPFHSTEIFHEYCASRSIYAPVPTIACCNPLTKQWIQDIEGPLSPPQILKECMKLAEQDPNWGMGPCFCCCGGGYIQTEAFLENTSSSICNVEHGTIPNNPNRYVSFFTDEEATKLKASCNGPINCYNIEFLFKSLKAYYSDIIFLLDESIEEPNVYSFNQAFKRKVVLVSGALTKITSLDTEGLAMIIGQAIGRFYGGSPITENNFTCTSNADFYAFATVSRNIWPLQDWFSKTNQGLTQIKQLFKLLGQTSAEGSCKDPGLQCRIEAMENGFSGGLQSTCEELLVLNSAISNNSGIDLVFNLGLKDTLTIQDQHNYQITPALIIQDISLDGDKGYVLHLSTDYPSPNSYKICVSNLLSTYNTTLDPNASCASFTIKLDSIVEKKDEL